MSVPASSALEAYRGARALVLGPSGFIGRWVARALAGRGAEVVLAVRDARRAERLFEAWGIEGRIRLVDFSRPGSAEDLYQDERPLIAFLLAGYGVDPAERDEGLARRLNAELPLELALAAERARDPRWRGMDIVHVGSALEFGGVAGDLSDPWSCRPETLYGRTKLEGSRAVARVAEGGRLRALNARLFTVYGPGEREGRLLPTLARAALSSEPIALTAGSQRRDFTYVEDVAEGLLRLGRVEVPDVPRALNLATGRLESVRRFVEIAALELGIAPERLDFGALPTRAEEQVHDPVSTEELARLTGWTPPTSIAEGVRRTAAFRAG